MKKDMEEEKKELQIDIFSQAHAAKKGGMKQTKATDLLYIS